MLAYCLLGFVLLVAGDVQELNSSNFDEKIADGSLWFVKFYAPWCGTYCSMLSGHCEEGMKYFAQYSSVPRQSFHGSMFNANVLERLTSVLSTATSTIPPLQLNRAMCPAMPRQRKDVKDGGAFNPLWKQFCVRVSFTGVVFRLDEARINQLIQDIVRGWKMIGSTQGIWRFC